MTPTDEALAIVRREQISAADAVAHSRTLVEAGADMVKFAKNGSDVTTAAIRLARAVTGRTKIAVCNHPFFSVDDWFIGATDMAASARSISSSRAGGTDGAEAETRTVEREHEHPEAPRREVRAILPPTFVLLLGIASYFPLLNKMRDNIVEMGVDEERLYGAMRRFQAVGERSEWARRLPMYQIVKFHGSMVINRNHPYHLLADALVKITARIPDRLLPSQPTWSKELTYEPAA